MRPRRRANVRVLGIGLVLVLAWGGVGYRLFDIQVADAAAYAARGEDQRLRRETLAAARGTIFDRDHHELAVTIDAVTVFADPREVTDPDFVASQLAPLTGEAYDVLVDRLSRDAAFVYVARQLDRRQAQLVQELGLQGIHFTEEPKRYYPAGDLAAQVVGFVGGDEGAGLEGVELQYDAILAGTPGELLVERDLRGRVIPQGRYAVTPPRPGADLVLTLDREIQFALQSALDTVVRSVEAEAATAVVVHVPTGEILAMGSAPTFDPNDLSRVDADAIRNRAVTDTFEPGSTQKLITVAAALEEGVFRPGDVLDVPETITIHDKEYEDVGKHPPQLTIADIVTYSSNVGTILIQQELGNAMLHEYLSRFGFGQATGLDYPGEAAGVLRDPRDWCETTCGANTAIGYRVSVTALQIAAAYAAVTNDGVWIQPHLVREIIDVDGSRRGAEPVVRPVLSTKTAAQLRVMLEGVVDRGTGTNAAVPGYRIGGKTGTTKKYDPELFYEHEDVVASFIGMGPISDPEVVVAVMIDTPAGGEFGGEVAAPVFAEIMAVALHQLGIIGDD